MPSRKLDDIIASTERVLGRAFVEVLADIRDGVRISEIESLIGAGDIDAVIAYLQIDEAAWQPLSEGIRQAYMLGGATGAAQMGRVQSQRGLYTARFDVRNPRAEQWLARSSSTRVVEIVEEQRAMLRYVLADGMSAGRGPRETALSIVGRINPATKRREGGFIGLTNAQSGWIVNARRDLELLTASRGEVEAYFARMGKTVPPGYDPLDSYMKRALRDRRFDSAVKKAYTEGRPLPPGTLDGAITRMQARAERYRGESIARTEGLNALRGGQWEAIEQAVEALELPAADTVKIWDSSGDDGRTREDHLTMEGVSVPVDEPFTLPDGSQLMYPGDSSLGAPASQTIQCRCRARYEVDFGAVARRMEGF